MTAKAPTPMPEGMNRENRPKAPAAPPKPTTKLYVGGKLVMEKEVRPQSEWEIDPIFLKGVGDDSKLVQLIKDYFEEAKNQ